MTYIIFNTINFPIINFTRNISFSPDSTVSSNAYCDLGYLSNEQINTLLEVAESPITYLGIKADDKVIYDAGEITARISSVDEALDNNQIRVSMSIIFD